MIFVMSGTAFGLGSGDFIFDSAALKKRTDDPITAADEVKLYYKKETDTYTKLLLHMDRTGSNFVDTTGNHNVAGYGAQQVSTPASPLTDGANVASFDGTGDYLSILDSADWDFGSGDFTIDTWVYFTKDMAVGVQQLIGQFESR